MFIFVCIMLWIAIIALGALVLAVLTNRAEEAPAMTAKAEPNDDGNPGAYWNGDILDSEWSDKPYEEPLMVEQPIKASDWLYREEFDIDPEHERLAEFKRLQSVDIAARAFVRNKSERNYLRLAKALDEQP